MRNENMVVLIGNLTKDPELRLVSVNGKGVSVVRFRLAVSDEYRTSSGNLSKTTTYINCEAWDSAADYIAKTLAKGDLVFVKGSLRSESWEKDGIKRESIKVRVGSFTPLFKKDRTAVGVASESENSDPGFDDNNEEVNF